MPLRRLPATDSFFITPVPFMVKRSQGRRRCHIPRLQAAGPRVKGNLGNEGPTVLDIRPYTTESKDILVPEADIFVSTLGINTAEDAHEMLT